MNIHIKIIPHSQHRYPTAGDWWYDMEGNIEIRVSKMSNWRYECLIATHELVEVLYCKWRNIPEEDVTRFDKQFEADRAVGNTSEPGDHPDAPYRIPHCFATGIERLLAAVLNVTWSDYEREIESL